MAKLDRGRGVSSYDLYGHGVPRGLVEEWVPDALVRGLVEFDLDHRSLVLTPKGKRKAKS
ncbi:MAG TPA: hypothetical protein VFY99_01845 [Solirubrobacterales bacterium]